MVVGDVGKLALIVVFTIGLFGLIAFNTITFDDAAPFLTLIAGYLFGNGAAAVRRSAPSSVLVGHIKRDEVMTIAGAYPAHTESDGAHDTEA